MVRRDAYEDIGGFDEQFYPAWYEDVDFCRRLKTKGWEIYFPAEGGVSSRRRLQCAGYGFAEFPAFVLRQPASLCKKAFRATGTVAIRASIAAGMIGRMIGRPKQAAAYG